MIDWIETLSQLDLAAVAMFFAMWLGYEIYGERASARRANLSGIMQDWRVIWFEEVLHRDNRILDIQILRSLAGNSAFLASTAIFVIGGLAALIGASQQAVEVLNRFEYIVKTDADRFGLMIAMLIVIFINAFFRLAWSLRLHNNAAVVLGALPQPGVSDNPDEVRARAAVAARLVSLAARHYNNGMHAYYFGLAACAWFVHPVLLMASSIWVVIILYRREFLSRAYKALCRE